MSDGICSVEGCEAGVKARGWCTKHYARWAKHGDPLWQPERQTRVCVVEGCDNPHYARGWCKPHYDRFWEPDARCAVDGCDGPARSRGWCPKHHMRFLKYGDPLHLENRRVTHCKRGHSFELYGRELPGGGRECRLCRAERRRIRRQRRE